MASIYDVLRPVQSSMFSRAGYNDHTWDLLFEFKSTGEIRCYKNVSPEVADEAFNAKSLGTWWNQNIRGNTSWEYEILGAVPFQEQPEKAEPVVEGGLTEEELNFIAPPPVPKAAPILEEVQRKMEAAIGAMMATADVPLDSIPAEADGGVTRDSGPDGTQRDSSLVTDSKTEMLGTFPVPQNPIEAIAFLQMRRGEIEALIAQNKDQAIELGAISVIDPSTHLAAADNLKALVEKRDQTTGILEPFRATLYEAYTIAQNLKKAALDPLEQAITVVKRSMLSWEQKMEQERQRKAREAQEEADRIARALQQKQSEQMTLAEMTSALESGDTAKAEQLVAKPIEVPLPYVPPAAVEPAYLPPSGQSTVKNWKIDEDSIDLVVFLNAVKAGEYPVEQAAKLIKADVPALNKLAKALESAFNVPGMRAFNDPVKKVRRGK